jgi:phytoene dehydrogenase-like protein
VSALREHYDVVVAGGGHNGLVAATYLGRAGLSVLVLERLAHVGGAAVSTQPFRGHEARVSPYSSLVSLLPDQLVEDLGLDLRLASRTTSTYAPTFRDGKPGGLLVARHDDSATRASFEAATGGSHEYDAWRELHADLSDLAHAVAPSMLEPLPIERAIRDQVDTGIWRDFVTNPLGATLEERFADETVRGIVAGHALVGTFASLQDPSLAQNRCFLYRAIGNGTGEARVPVGGMGAVTDALARAARVAGVEILSSVGVSGIRGGDSTAEVQFHDGMSSHTVEARFALANVAPWVLQILLGEPEDRETKPRGAQLKIDLLVDRLPTLRSGIDPAVALAGTMHLGSDYAQLEKAYAEAAAGQVPSVVPGLLDCPSLTDPSVVGSSGEGRHTLTFLGLHTPAALFDGDDRAAAKERAVAGALAAINEHLVEPIESCLARDAHGNPCLEARTPQDVEADLAMPGGHIYHGDLDWPWASNRARLDTPAQQWGVQTDVGSVLVCGSGARRGGGVSGLGGHNAAQAVLAHR